MSTLEVIEALEQPIPQDLLRQRPGGNGVILDYIDWPVAVRRLNEAVGTDNWDFEVSDLRFIGDDQAGYAICKGRLTIRFPDGTVASKEQYGGNHWGRLQSGRQGLNPDDAAKAAASDAVKKCASLFGIALDLSEKAPQNSGQQNGYAQPEQNRPVAATGGSVSDFSADGDPLYCEECSEPLTETQFKDGTRWTPAQLAVFGRRKHSRILCMTDYRKANQQKRAAEEALSSVPF